jgi:hypothetical protein
MLVEVGQVVGPIKDLAAAIHFDASLRAQLGEITLFESYIAYPDVPYCQN